MNRINPTYFVKHPNNSYSEASPQPYCGKDEWLKLQADNEKLTADCVALHAENEFLKGQLEVADQLTKMRLTNSANLAKEDEINKCKCVKAANECSMEGGCRVIKRLIRAREK